LALENKRTIMLVSIRYWRLFGKIWYNGYHQNAELRRCAFVLHGFGEYMNAVLLWWLWDFDVKTLSGIIKPVFSGSKEQYTYFIYEYFKLEL